MSNVTYRDNLYQAVNQLLAAREKAPTTEERRLVETLLGRTNIMLSLTNMLPEVFEKAIVQIMCAEFGTPSNYETFAQAAQPALSETKNKSGAPAPAAHSGPEGLPVDSRLVQRAEWTSLAYKNKPKKGEVSIWTDDLAVSICEDRPCYSPIRLEPGKKYRIVITAEEVSE